MEFQFEVWHWLVLGMALLAIEMFVPIFTALWFGVAALVVGLLLWFLPDWSPTGQLLTWAILSIISALLWFKYLKPLSVDRTKAGLSREAVIGQVGFITVLPQASRVGTVRFSLPASQEAIMMVTQAVGDSETPVTYLLGEQYIKAMQELAKSNNAKTVVLPADLLHTVRGLMGR